MKFVRQQWRVHHVTTGYVLPKTKKRRGPLATFRRSSSLSSTTTTTSTLDENKEVSARDPLYLLQQATVVHEKAFAVRSSLQFLVVSLLGQISQRPANDHLLSHNNNHASKSWFQKDGRR